MSQTKRSSETSFHILDDPDPDSNESEVPKGGSRFNEFEARLDMLETAILEHATVLRDRIATRLDRLEDKLRFEATGLRQAVADERGARDEKIVQLTESFTAAVDRVELQSQAGSGSVSTTMEDLIAALAATRSHLDTLAVAVSKTRTELPS